MKFVCTLVILFFSGMLSVRAQQPPYTPKKFVNYFDTVEFKIVYPRSGNGMISTYVLTELSFWDIDDDNTTHIMGSGLCLINIRGYQEEGKRKGIFTTYLIDSGDHSRRFKIYEQEYKDDKLNGEWRIFNLRGTLVSTQTYKNDSLNGINRTYWIDGKSIMEEREFFGGSSRFIERGYLATTGKIVYETSVLNEKMDGVTKEYYEDGSLKREAFFSKGILNGTFRYYYPGGKLWIEQVFNNGKPWEVVGNYDKSGKPREKGTLKNGNGTIYLYNEDGSVREIEDYMNGELKK